MQEYNYNTIYLNHSHIVHGTKKSVLKYDFFQAIAFEKSSLSLLSMTLNTSWYNISEALNNNKFSYKWFDNSGELTVNVNITIQDGVYTVNNLNEYIQSRLYSNGHYYKQVSSGNIIYPFLIQTNETYYALQLTVFAMRTASADYVKGSTDWNWPSSFTTPQFIINSTNTFYQFLGISPGTYPSEVETTTQTYSCCFVYC